MSARIFAEDWRACLREQYRAVLAAGDAHNENTLRGVLLGVGFAAGELAGLPVVEPASPPKESLASVEPAAAMSVSPPVAGEPPEEPALTLDEPEPGGLTESAQTPAGDGGPADDAAAGGTPAGDAPPPPEDQEPQLSLF